MTYTKKRNLIIAAVIFLAGIMAGGRIINNQSIPINPSDDEIYTVASVIDGDTIKINNGRTRVRLLGIDAPDKGECYFEKSKQALKNLVAGKKIKLQKDISDKDIYERLLRYVILVNDNQDNLLVNDYMVREGYAQKYTSAPDNRYRDLFATAQEIAQRNKSGIWRACHIQIDLSKREENFEPTNPDCIIKGNISEKGYGKTYLIPGCDNYDNVKIDLKKGEAYFCTEEEAQKDGFRKATNCP